MDFFTEKDRDASENATNWLLGLEYVQKITRKGPFIVTKNVSLS